MTKDQEIQVEMIAFTKRVEDMGCNSSLAIVSKSVPAGNFHEAFLAYYKYNGEQMAIIDTLLSYLKQETADKLMDFNFIANLTKTLGYKWNKKTIDAFLKFLITLQNEPPTITLPNIE